ncbi:MAG: type II secretion system protein GspL [Chromatiales bacterium]
MLKGSLDGDVWSWLTLDGSGGVAAGPATGSLEQAAEVAPGRQVIWLVGSEDIRIEQREIPARSRKQLAQAIPYALEDELAEDVAELHFAFAADGDRVSVAVVRRALLRGALERLGSAGISPARAIPDCLAVPLEEGRWSLLVDQDRVLLRNGPRSGMVCDPAMLSLVLSSALAETPEESRPDGLRLWECASGTELPELPLETEAETCVSALEAMAAGLTPQGGIDLLQGEFSAHERQARQLRRWWPVAAMLAVGAILAMVDKGLEVNRLERRQALVSERIQEVFRETFPDASRVVDARVQMEQRLSALRSEQGDERGFLGMLADAVEPLESQPGIQLKGVEFRNQVLELNLAAGDVQQLDALRQALEAGGTARAEIQSVNVEGGRVAARIRIRGGGG